jgi:hypothetical protein
MICTSASALRPSGATQPTARTPVRAGQVRVSYLDVRAELAQRTTPLPPFADRQGADRNNVFGLEPRHLRDRQLRDRYLGDGVTPATPLADDPPAPTTHGGAATAEPANRLEYLPSFDTVTAELRRRAMAAASRPQLMPSVALPLIVTLSSLLWVAILKGLDFGSLLSDAAHLAFG